MHIKDLVPDPANRRQHNPRNIGMLRDALGKVGASRSIVVDEHDVILAGNGVVEAASEAGLTKVQVVEADGETLIAVRRRGLTDAQKRELAIYDNRTAELATWNVEQLQADLRDGLDLAPFFFEDELQALFASQGGVKQGRTDPDAVPAARATDIQRGDLFELGGHRLLCGDCTAPADVGRLMRDVEAGCVLTDPPYGQNQPGVPNDSPAVNFALLNGAIEHIPVMNGAGVFFQSPRTFPHLLDTARAFGWEFARMLWLDKVAQCAYPWRGWILISESILVFTKGVATWIDVHPYSHDIYRVSEVSGEIPDDIGWHGAIKPIKVVVDILSRIGGNVYDPFLGSGTTLIAAEMLGRQAMTLEIEPIYCQVSIDRWEAFTGQKAVKVGEAIRA